MQAYEVILHERAWNTLARPRAAEKLRLLGLLETLGTTPFRPGDFQQPDITGRSNQVLLLGDWLITYWSDHAAREIRVVNLEHVED